MPTGHELTPSIKGPCGGGCDSACVPPSTEFVRITSVRPVASWRQETATSEQTITLPAAPTRTVFSYTTQDLIIDAASHLSVRVELRDAAPDQGPPYIFHGPVVADRHRVHVMWTNQAPTPVTVRWVAHLTSEDMCRGEPPCTPPAAPPRLVEVKGE